MSIVPLEEYLRVSDELEAMRDVVESVRALADRWQWYADECAAQDPPHRPKVLWAVAAQRVRAALAPVPSGWCGEGGPEY